MELLSASSPNKSKGSFSLKSVVHNSTTMNSPLANMSRTANHANENISSVEITGLYVRNVPHDMMNDDLGNVFKQHGRVLSVFIKKSDNASYSSTFAIIKVPSKREAVKMIECVNGMPPFKFRVEIALTEEEKNRRRAAKETSAEHDEQVDEMIEQKESAIRTFLNSIPKPKLSECPAKGIGRGLQLRDSIEKQSAKIFPKIVSSNYSIGKLPLNGKSQTSLPEAQTSCSETKTSILETQISFPEASISLPEAQNSFFEASTRPKERNVLPEARTLLQSPRAAPLSISAGRSNCDPKKSNRNSTSSVLRRECIRCKSPANSRCGVCKASYCSRECQNDDWFYHKETCSKPPPLEECHGYVRVGRMDSTKSAENDSVKAVSCHREDDSYQIDSVWGTLEPGSTHQGYITAMETIESFSMLVFVEEAQYLMDDGSAILSTTPSVPDFNAKVGEFIASYSESDGAWCRSYVFAVRDGEYGVYQIDFGFPEIVTEIKPLPEGPCSHLASIGMHCLLNDESLLNGEILEETIQQNSAIAFTVHRKENGSLLINILAKNGLLDSNLYQVLPWYRCIPTNTGARTNETDGYRAACSTNIESVREPASAARVPAAPVVREPALIARESSPPLAREPASSVVKESAPILREPALPLAKEPTPVVKEPVASVVREPVAPVVREPVAPVVREPVAPVVREPVAPVVREPVAPVVREPSTVVREYAATVKREPVAPVKREPVAPVVREPVAPVVREPVASVVREPVASVVREPAASVVMEPTPVVREEPSSPSVYLSVVDSSPPLLQSAAKPSIERFIGSAIPQIELSVGEECPVIAVWHEGDTVFMQITLETNLLAFQTLMSAIHEHCINSSPIPSVSVGELVCTYIENDGMWYRARVIKVAKDQSKVKVCMLDFGNSEVLPLTSLRPFDKQFLSTPQMSIRVNLAHPEDPEKILTGVEARLAKLCSESEGNDKIVVKYCQGTEEVTYNASIYCSEVCINEELCPQVSNEVTQSISDVAAPSPPTNEAMDMVPPNLTYDECEFVPLIPGENKELVILDVTNTHTIMVMPKESIGLMETLEEVSVKMNEYCNALTTVYHKPSEGDLLLVKYSQDGLWYRAACIVSGEDSATVQFVDYGNVETVLFDCIVRMINEFLKPVPILASHTILEGCGDTVNDAASDHVKKLLPTFTVVTADAVSVRDQDTYTYKITLNNVLTTLKQEGLV